MLKQRLNIFFHSLKLRLMSKELCHGIFKDVERGNDCKSRFLHWGSSDTQIFHIFLYSCLKSKCLYLNRMHASEALGMMEHHVKAEKEAHYWEAKESFWHWVQFYPRMWNATTVLHLLASPCTVLAPFSGTTWWPLVWLTPSSLFAVPAERAPAFFTKIQICLLAPHCSDMIMCYSED